MEYQDKIKAVKGILENANIEIEEEENLSSFAFDCGKGEILIMENGGLFIDNKFRYFYPRLAREIEGL